MKFNFLLYQLLNHKFIDFLNKFDMKYCMEVIVYYIYI